MADVLLAETLALAVPMRIGELLGMPATRRGEVAMRWARRAADLVACNGDMLLFRAKAGKKHTPACTERRQRDCDCLIGTAEVFNAMAKGLAAGALAPGGASFAGIHWCADHPAGIRTDEPWKLGCAGTGYFPRHNCNCRRCRAATAAGRPVVTVELPEVVAR
jgi:hypothetical protein